MTDPHAKAQLILAESDAEKIEKGDLIVIYLDAIEVDTKQFCSRDYKYFLFNDPEREGMINLNLSDQTTIIPYVGCGQVYPKYLDKVAYLGEYCGWLSFDISIIERDRQDEKWWQALNQGIKAVSQFPFLKTGANLLDSLLKYIKTQISDDEEARAFLMQESALRDGQTLSAVFGDPNHPLAKITMRIEKLGKITGSKSVSVRINHPRLQFDDPAQASKELKDKGMEIFNFEATCKRDQSAYTTDVNHVLSNVTWQSNELFVTKAVDAGDQVLPLLLNFSINSKKFNAEAFSAGLNAGMELSQAAGQQLNPIIKQTPTILNFISEITANNFSIFAFNGILILARPGDQSRQSALGNIVLNWDEERKVWSTHLKKELSWIGNHFGSFEFDLEVRPIN